MDTKQRSNGVVNFSMLADGRMQFEVRGTGAPLVFDPRLASMANRRQAELHGWKQRISDAAAKSRDAATGQSASPFEKREAMEKLIAHYESGAGEWAMRAQSGRGLGLVREALARIGVAQDKIADLSDDKLKELSASKRVKEAMLEIEQERLANANFATDADAELDELIGE